MIRVWAVALCTIREAVREKLLYNLVAFALFLIGSTILLSRLTLGDFHRLVLDVGMASINLFGVVIAIFVGVGLVNREIDRKTIYVVLSKTIPRWQFLLGKYLGLACTVAGIWRLSTGRVSRYAPRSPASAPVSTRVRTVSSRKNGFPRFTSIRVSGASPGSGPSSPTRSSAVLSAGRVSSRNWEYIVLLAQRCSYSRR